MYHHKTSPQPPPPPSSPSEFRQRIYTLIDKLTDRSTLSRAETELKLITKQSLSSTQLSIFLSCILSVNQTCKSYVRISCINFITYLTNNNNSHAHALVSHIPNTILPSLLRHLKADPTTGVRSAVVSAVAALSPLGFSSLVGPLFQSVLSEPDVGGRLGSCLALKSAVENVGTTKFSHADVEFMKKGVKKVVKLVRSKGCRFDKVGLLSVVGSVVGVVGGGGCLVVDVVACATEMLSCDEWATRKVAAEVLEVVVVKVEMEFIVGVKVFVVGSLESKRFDKVKITRETINRALEAWKNVPNGPHHDLPLSTSNSSISKENGCGDDSPPSSRTSSFAGSDTPKSRKKIARTTSSSSDGRNASISSSNRRKTMSKSRSSSSDESTITDSSLVSKSSNDNGGISEIRGPSSGVRKKSTSLKNNNTTSRKRLDWQFDVVFHSGSDDMEVATSGSEASSNFYKKTPVEEVAPFVEEDDLKGLVSEGKETEGVDGDDSDCEELSLIRNRLLQMEKQQNDMVNLLQRFVGNSQRGVNSLESRVCGLEKALDEISYGLDMQSGKISRYASNYPNTEFLSSKLKRKIEG